MRPSLFTVFLKRCGTRRRALATLESLDLDLETTRSLRHEPRKCGTADVSRMLRLVSNPALDVVPCGPGPLAVAVGSR